MIELFEDVVLVRALAKRIPFFGKAVHWVREDEVQRSSTYLTQLMGDKNLNSVRIKLYVSR